MKITARWVYSALTFTLVYARCQSFVYRYLRAPVSRGVSLVASTMFSSILEQRIFQRPLVLATLSTAKFPHANFPHYYDVTTDLKFVMVLVSAIVLATVYLAIQEPLVKLVLIAFSVPVIMEGHAVNTVN